MTDEQKEDAAAPIPKGAVAARQSGLGWIPYLALCAAGLIIGLTSIGPSASEGLGTLNTMAFWALHVVPALVLLAISQMGLGQIERVSMLPGLVQVILSATVAAVLFTPFALVIDSFFAGQAALDDDGDTLWLRLASEFSHFFVPLVLIWTLINAPSLLQLERSGRPLTRKVEADADPPPSLQARDELAEFWSRIPGRLSRRLVALSAELHYLPVHTTEGDTLILFSFGRAVDLLQEQIGMQIHRSHWVALDRIDDVISRDGRVTCHMIGGLSFPVSRSFRSALKAARRGLV